MKVKELIASQRDETTRKICTSIYASQKVEIAVLEHGAYRIQEIEHVFNTPYDDVFTRISTLTTQLKALCGMHCVTKQRIGGYGIGGFDRYYWRK